jgi:hypothetical protein
MPTLSTRYGSPSPSSSVVSVAGAVAAGVVLGMRRR